MRGLDSLLVSRYLQANGRVGDVMAQTCFKHGAEWTRTRLAYVRTDKHRIPQRVLDQQTLIQALKVWRDKSPYLVNVQ